MRLPAAGRGGLPRGGRPRALWLSLALLAAGLSTSPAFAEHASLSGDPSDAAAARRRAEILRSPYLQPLEGVAVAGGEVVVRFDAATAATATTATAGSRRRSRLLAIVEQACGRLFDEARWVRPFSTRSPLEVYLVAPRTPGKEGPSVAAWERRERTGFVRPLVLVEAEGKTDQAVLLDVARQVALLSARFSAPAAEPWAVEAVAEWAGRRAAETSSQPVPAADPLLASAGSVAAAPSAASLLSGLEGLVSTSDVRDAWEASGAAGGGGEAFLTELASRAGLGLAELLAEVVTRRAAVAASLGVEPARPPLPSEGAARGPGALGWAWFDLFPPGGEGDGVELLVAPSPAPRSARVLLAYRQGPGPGDSVPLVPGVPVPFPRSSGGTRLLVVDGGEDSLSGPHDLRVSVRSLPGYPASVEALSARRVPGGVEVSWRTASHRDLLAWAVVREPEPGSGAPRVTLDLVPTTEASEEGMSYLLLDRAPLSTRASYRLYALTSAGALAERGTAEAAPPE